MINDTYARKALWRRSTSACDLAIASLPSIPLLTYFPTSLRGRSRFSLITTSSVVLFSYRNGFYTSVRPPRTYATTLRYLI